MLLLHGLMASTHVFDEVISLGRKEFRFLSLDLPHSGKSLGWAQMNPVRIAARLKPWLQSKGLEQVTVFGHSFGGLVGLELAVGFPKWVQRLVIASAPALGLHPQAKQLLHLPGAHEGAAMIARLPLWKPLVRSYMQWLFGEPRKLTDRHIEGYFQSLQNPGSWVGMLEATRSVAAYKLPSAAMLGSKIPVEVLWGDRDKLVSLIDGERLAVAIDAGFTVLHGVGHCVPEESPEAVLEAIRGTSAARKAKDRGRRDIDEGA